MRKEIELMDGWYFLLSGGKQDKFTSINLPHDWAINSEFNPAMQEGANQGFRDSLNIGVYKRNIHITQLDTDSRYFLEFGGIYENSTIYLNGVKIGGRKYGYSSFRVELTGVLCLGDNTVLVEVDCSKRPTDRWYSGAGIYRTIKMIQVPNDYLDRWEVQVKTQKLGDSGQVVIETDKKNQHIRAKLSYKEQYLTKESNSGKIIIDVEQAYFWTAETPNLYKLTLEYLKNNEVVDQISSLVGIRTIEMVPNIGMLVNGKKVSIKGVCLHQDVGCRGIAAKEEIYKERLGWLKSMGCNAIRAAHHIFSEEFLNLCDQMGFYVYEECFDKWRGGHYGNYFENDWKKDVEVMVKRDRNHPSIFMWGVGNEVENQGQNSMLKDLKMLKDFVKSLDETRPISYAMNPHFKREHDVNLSKIIDIQKFVDEEDDYEIYDNEERLEYIGRIAEIVDVIGCNYQEQWYSMIHEKYPDKLILGTETYQFFQGHKEQMQNYSVSNPNLIGEKLNYVIGSMIWTGIDYLGESMGYPSKGWTGSLIRTNGVKRPGYYIMKSYWSDEPMIRFFVMDYTMSNEGTKAHWSMPPYASHWDFPQFKQNMIPFMIATNCESVILYLNSKKIYLSNPQEYKDRLITGFIPYQKGNVMVEGYIGENMVCKHSLNTPEKAARLEFEPEMNGLSLPCEKGCEQLLRVQAQDINGNHCFRVCKKIRFRIEGPAKILGVDNGYLNSNEKYEGNTSELFQGTTSVLIRLTGEKGNVSIYAESDGLISGKIQLSVY